MTAAQDTFVASGAEKTVYEIAFGSRKVVADIDPVPPKLCKRGHDQTLLDAQYPSGGCKACKAITIQRKCPHDKQKSRCKDCGGVGICLHSREKDKCKDCGGVSICEHGRRRSECKDCGGVSICEHNRLRPSCSTCKPDGAFKKCKHGASGKRINFTLSLEEYKSVVAQPCFYCNESEQPRGIDRWDNDKLIGYTLDNSRPCCWPCNKLKGDKDGCTFVAHCQRIGNHTQQVKLLNSLEASCSTQ